MAAQDTLFSVLNALNLPYYRQGSLSDEDYPNTFYTYWNFDTNNEAFYDNSEHRHTSHYWVYTYTNNVSLIYSTMDNFITAAKAAGIICEAAYDTKADKPNYYGRVCLIKIID